MRVLQAKTKRPLDLLAIGAAGHIAAGCALMTVRGDVDVWQPPVGHSVQKGEEVRLGLSSLVFHPNGDELFIGAARSLNVAALSTNTTTTLEGRVILPEVAFTADGLRVLLTYSRWDDEESGIIELRELTDGKFSLVSGDWVWDDAVNEGELYGCATLNPAGTRVATSVDDFRRDRVRQRIQFRDAISGQVINEIEFDPADPVRQLLFSIDGSKLLARSSGRSVKVFDVASGQSAGELVHPGRPYVSGMAVHPNGTVACSRNNGTVCLWNLEKRELVRTLDWKLGKLVSVAFSPDGNIGAAGTEDGQVIVWDVDE